jgi:exodeoxyribonuclease-5
MKWSGQQDAALKAVDRWLADDDQQCFRLFGYAGTGKTTLAKHFAEGIDGRVLYGAYTGKAAYVLREKGCPGASTIHSMIYHTKEKGRARLRELEQSLAELRMELREEYPKEDDPKWVTEQIEEHRRVKDIRELIAEERSSISQPTFALNPESEARGARLIVIDECSMVDDRMGEDLLSFGTKVLVLGDPAQLPPVFGAGFFTEGITPDIMLTDIHRQAADNPIIAMATQTREEQGLALGNYGDSLVIEKAHINESFATDADQILVGRNKTRHASNRRMRELLGHKELLPVPEDKLVCLRNNHEKGLLNGAIWHVDDVGYLDEDKIYMTLNSDIDKAELEVEAHTHHFLGNGDQLPWWERKEAEEFDYGYALTVHKSQGSQWDHVLLFDESFCFRADRWRWLYTGLTRAANRVVVVRV